MHDATARTLASSGAEPIKLLVVDDHPLVRESVALFLGAESDFKVVGALDSADASRRFLEKDAADVVLTDIEMPGGCAFALARETVRAAPTTRFIFFSGFLTDNYLANVMAIKGSGYLLKSAPVGEIARAVREVHQGRSYYSRGVADRMRLAGSAIASAPESRLARLTAREQEVLRCVASDMTGKEIAVALGLSARTVDRHKANIMGKLGLHSQVGLTRFAVAEGLCDPRESPQPPKT
jgi:DNA-binding NarL/FixJ family response regulator